MSKFILSIYLLFSRIIRFIFGRVDLKGFFELLYWRYRLLLERHLKKDHYEYFYTGYFDLDRAYYRSKNVLDIGCGPRGSLEWANGTSCRVGLDPLALKYQALGASRHKMEYICAGSENIPFKEGSFDVVCSFNSLDHVDNLDKAVADIIRVLAPGGIFLLITEIHTTPTVCEPSAFGWDITGKFKSALTILEERHYEKSKGIYQSIKAAAPYDQSDKTKRFGILTVKMIKPETAITGPANTITLN
jgi:SAM-dependent methyltransferase